MMILALLLALFVPVIAEAATINAASCSYADVNTAVNTTPAVHGDTVQIPSGTCTWTSQLVMTGKSITFQGAAAIPLATTLAEAQAIETVCNTGGQTTYTCLKRAGSYLSWTTTNTGITILKNIAFVGQTSPSGCSPYSLAAVTFYGRSDNLRVTGNLFSYVFGCGGLLVRDDNRGVADHNTILAKSATEHGVIIQHNKWLASGIYGDKSWASPLTVGTGSAFFLEDNFFTTTLTTTQDIYYTDHIGGARIVHRFNTFDHGSTQTHGTETGGRIRGPVQQEAYRNKFPYGTAVTAASQIALRGIGTGYTFDNIATGNMNNVVDLNNYRASPNQDKNSFYPWGYCGKLAVTLTRVGTTVTATTASEHGVHTSGVYINITGASDSAYNGTALTGHRVDSTHFTYVVASTPTSASDSGTLQGTYDHNTDNAGYECLDQIGRGPGDLLSGEGPADGNTMSPKAWLNQPLSPHYCWNNTDDGAVRDCAIGAGSTSIVSLRDIYNQNASFDGTTQHGIGRGARASRPASCTIGDGWWATDGGGNWNTSTTETYSASPGDDGGLDKCTGTNTWTNDAYVPYTYPHPLIPADTPPAPAALSGTPLVMAFHGANFAIFECPKSADAAHKAYNFYRCTSSDACSNLVKQRTPAIAASTYSPETRFFDSSLLIAATYYYSCADVNTSDYVGPATTAVGFTATGKQ